MSDCDQKLSELQLELTSLLNKYSVENRSDTPDFILAEYMMNCLAAYSSAVKLRDSWHRRVDK